MAEIHCGVKPDPSNMPGGRASDGWGGSDGFV